MRLPRRKRVDRVAWPMDYTGPETSWGLDPGTPCRVLRSWAGGGLIIQTLHGGTFTVARSHVSRP